MTPSTQPFWVTIEHPPGWTRDHRLRAPSPWAARWLWHQLHPDHPGTVRHVRPAR